MIITATLASGNGSFELGSFPPIRISAGILQGKGNQVPQPERRVVAINNYRPQQELYGNLTVMSRPRQIRTELLIQKMVTSE